MTQVLILTPDVVAERMAGPAIRAWQMALELSKLHEVRLVSLASMAPEKLSDQFDVSGGHTQRELRDFVRWAEVVVVQGTVTSEYPWILRSEVKLVVDLYDPMHLELLEQTADMPIEQRIRIVGTITDTLNVQIERADFLLCASHKQRDFWLGQMAAIGRVNPVTYAESGQLEKLLAIAPFGLEPDQPVRTRPAIKGVVPGISVDDEVLIWGGGIYNWFDPLTLVSAMALVSRIRPTVRLFFMGSGHPNPAVPQMSIAHDALELASELGLLNRFVFFNDEWVPYEERAQYLLDADLGVSTHKVHLETEFSFRTRILDYLWVNLPMVVTEGDGFAELISSRGLGAVVSESNPEELAAAIISLLENPALRKQMIGEIRLVANEFEWPNVFQSLVEFCNAPRVALDRSSNDNYLNRTRINHAIVSSLRHSWMRRPARFAARVKGKITKLVRSD